MRTDNLTFIQGTDGGWMWPIVDAAGEAIPDITGWTGRAQIREKVASPEMLAEFTTANDGIEFEILPINGEATSVVKLLYTHAMTTDWAFRKGVYDLEVVSPTGQVTRVTEGKVTVDPEVTR